MAREYKVSKAFLSTDDDKNPQIVKTQGGDMHKFIVQVEDQPVQGWLQILKKPGNEVKVGDVLYGDIVENNWGKPQFNRSQRPDGNFTPQQQAQPARPANTANTDLSLLEKKVDYIIEILEAARWFVEPTMDRPDPTDDDAPVNLSDLDY